MEGYKKTRMILLIISVLTMGRVMALSLEDFLNKLQGECFENIENFPFDLWKPDSATSVENFIYMVERIEKTYDGSTPDLIRALLKSFSCNRLGSNGRKSVLRDETGKWFEQIMDEYLKDEPEPKVPELTKEERCQFFFMLSPAMKTISEKDESGQKQLHGFGVVNVKGDEERAIDMSKVLYGIYAGIKDDPTKQISDLIPRDQQDDHANEEVRMLYASTISEVINAASMKNKGFTEKNYIHEGTWSSNICAKEYIYYNSSSTWPSTAEIVGAIDGFVLGTKIKEVKLSNEVKLSQILRMYYSQDGFKVDAVDANAKSYCNRLDYSFNADELKEQTVRYMRVYHRRSSDPVQATDVEVAERFSEKFRSLSSNLRQTKDEERDCSKDGKAGDTCETLSHVFVVLDKRDMNITFQELVTAKLINEMNIGMDEDAITIYLNADIENLHTIVNASESKAEASCALEGFDPNSLPKVAEDSKVLTDIKNIITIYEENQKSLRAVPSKVVVFFNFGKLEEQEKRALEKAKRELKSRHPYLSMIPVGNDTEYLKEYFTNIQPSRALSWDQPKPNLVHNLMNKICLVPAVLQHPNCNTKSKYEDSEYVGYIRNSHVQHWVMYPKHFLKTFSYKFQFQARYGKIRVCFSRFGPIEDSSASTNCKVIGETDQSVEFQGRDPCKDRTVHNCDPFYFSIFGRDDAEKSTCRREVDDKEVGCKRLDQTEYTIRHEGISCNSGRNVISSPLLQILLAFLVMCYILSQQK